MGIFDFLMGPDINQGIEEYHATQGAVLLDVRTPEEYRQGHTGRLGKPEELESICVYLAGDTSSFTTGADFSLDGAFTCF